MRIKKKTEFTDNKCNTYLKDNRDTEFNEGKEIEITEQEFEQIKHFRFFEEIKNVNSKDAGQKEKSRTTPKIKGS